MDLVKLIEALELSPVCALIFVASVWAIRELLLRNAKLTDRFLDEAARKAKLWDDSRREAEKQ